MSRGQAEKFPLCTYDHRYCTLEKSNVTSTRNLARDQEEGLPSPVLQTVGYAYKKDQEEVVLIDTWMRLLCCYFSWLFHAFADFFSVVLYHCICRSLNHLGADFEDVWMFIFCL